MASSPQCLNTTQGTAGLTGLPGGTAALRGLAPAVPPNYSDLEQLTQSPHPQQQHGSFSPLEPLTEFQKFIAASTGQVLPIYGQDLFRHVPSTFAPLQMTPVPPDYVIGPGDELRIRIWGQVNTQANVRVDRSGEIYLPQVGLVHVAGLPFSALEAHLREAVSRVYKNFDLTADVGQIRSIQVYVTGEARRPGQYTVSALSTLVNAIFASGGPSVQGSLRRIELRRNGTVLTTFDLYRLLLNGDKSKDVKLLDGDVLFIPPVGPQAAVTGSVRMPGIYELLNSESVGSLLNDAGGITALASGARISIERTDDRSDRQAMEIADDAVGRAAPVDDGDLVRVYSIVPSYRKTVTLRGNVANPGRFAWHPGMRIEDLIPDKQSLLTRNYWWRRASLGLPAPEFQPLPALGYLHQPSQNIPVTLPRSEVSLPNEANSPGSPQAPQIEQGPNASSGQAGSAALLAGTARQQSNPQGQQSLPAEQRASSTTIGAEETNLSSQTRPPAQPLQMKLSAPEIDWDYAVIERLDPETLKTKFIPFDLGKLVLDHDASQNLLLQPGDVVTIFSEADIRIPVAQQTKLVRLDGEFVHSGIYTVLPGETLRQLVARAGGFTPNAYLYGSEFTRESTRVFQQARIDEYVQSMNMSIQRGTLALVTAPAASPQDLASSAAAAGLERELLATLKQIRATGRIVLQFKPGSNSIESVPNLPLEDGDRFVVPPVPFSVNVVGAVYDQNAFLYQPGARVATYLQMAGGPNKDADRKHAFVIRADGEVISYAMAHSPWGNDFDKLRMFPGDTLVVPDKTLKPSLLRGVLDWSQLFSQFALGAAALTIIAP
jgi:protein involved in polysaccharide export with SLBB domain